MVIDDELDICIMLKVVLEQNGFLVNYYSNPIIGLDELKSNFYNLIILDVQMPDINGMQLYREIKKRDSKGKNMLSDGKWIYIWYCIQVFSCVYFYQKTYTKQWFN